MQTLKYIIWDILDSPELPYNDDEYIISSNIGKINPIPYELLRIYCIDEDLEDVLENRYLVKIIDKIILGHVRPIIQDFSKKEFSKKEFSWQERGKEYSRLYVDVNKNINLSICPHGFFEQNDMSGSLQYVWKVFYEKLFKINLNLD